jgi:hypothetical protein
VAREAVSVYAAAESPIRGDFGRAGGSLLVGRLTGGVRELREAPAGFRSAEAPWRTAKALRLLEEAGAANESQPRRS